jgi:hypothetical protein
MQRERIGIANLPPPDRRHVDCVFEFIKTPHWTVSSLPWRPSAPSLVAPAPASLVPPAWIHGAFGVCARALRLYSSAAGSFDRECNRTDTTAALAHSAVAQLLTIRATSLQPMGMAAVATP